MKKYITFAELGLNEALIQSLTENKISEPSEIQEKIIPLILTTQKPVLAVSQTGTGKTAAYGLPLLQLIDTTLQQTQVLIMVPTRELGQQVAKSLFQLSRYIVRIHTEAVYGGVKIEDQMKKIEIPRHILVATPGRLLDLLARKAVDLRYLKYLVLDEADEMLNMGFKPDIDKVLSLCKKEVRKMLFTSTVPPEIHQIIDNYLGANRTEVFIKPEEFVNKNIDHQYIAYQYGYKIDYLKSFLIDNSDERGIIFCRTKAATKLLSQQLKGFEVKVDALYGDLNQYERNKVMTAFKANHFQVLIATDIAARGIDVADLNFIIHYHLPDNEAQYVNRSGRTARAGKNGKSICMLQQDEIFHKNVFEKNLQIKMNPLFQDVEIDKSPSSLILLTINIGVRHGINEEKLLDYLVIESGIKAEFITDIQVYNKESTFLVNSRYLNQLKNNIHYTKAFNHRILVEENETNN